jgi:hypothetical protein
MNLINKRTQRLDAVAQAYNPSYSGDRDQEHLGSRPAWATKVHETPSQPMAGCSGICYSSSMGSITRKIRVQASMGINVRPYLKNN